MPILFNIEEIRKKHDCEVYLETGLWDARNENVSIKKAITSNFKKIFSIEILEEWIKIGNDILSEEIKSGRVEIINIDSADLSTLLNRKEFEDKTLFFLDAHVDNHEITNYKYRCPIFSEIDAIKNLKRKDNIILIDDMRAFDTPNPWNETKFENIDYRKEIENKILEINSDYIFEMIDDTMYCYTKSN